MIGGINSSMQNRIALVDERFISEALSSFVADVDHLDCRSIVARRVSKLKFRLKYFFFLFSTFPDMRQNSFETDSLAADWSFAGRKAAPPGALLRDERLCPSNRFGLPI